MSVICVPSSALGRKYSATIRPVNRTLPSVLSRACRHTFCRVFIGDTRQKKAVHVRPFSNGRQLFTEFWRPTLGKTDEPERGAWHHLSSGAHHFAEFLSMPSVRCICAVPRRQLFAECVRSHGKVCAECLYMPSVGCTSAVPRRQIFTECRRALGKAGCRVLLSAECPAPPVDGYLPRGCLPSALLCARQSVFPGGRGGLAGEALCRVSHSA